MKEIHVNDGPFIKSENKASNIMKTLLISLIPIIIFSIYKNGYIPFHKGATGILGLFYPLIFIVVATSASVITEWLYTILIKKEEQTLKSCINRFSVFPGLLLSLILPINTPIWLLIIATLIAVIIGKMVWGGLGSNKINPTLVGQIVIIIIVLLGISNISYLNKYELNSISSGLTPLENIVSIDSIGTYEILVQPYGSLWDFFFGTVPGGVGTTSTILVLLSYLFLVYKKAIKWRIPLIFVGTVFIMTYFIGFLNGVGLWYPAFQIMSGGLIFFAVFIATDSVTSPVTATGQIVYGIALGILTVIFRFLLPFIDGIVVSVLIMNLLVPFIDKLGSQARFDFKKISILILTEMVIVLALSLYIAEIKNIKVQAEENNKLIENI